MNSTPDARRGIRWLDAGDDRIPVHWRYDDSEATYVVNHLFVQDGRPVRHPLVAGVANAARQVLRGPRPITLLLVDGLGPSSRREAIERSAEEWLRAAWHRYSAECRG
jgi:hypothetical protein